MEPAAAPWLPFDIQLSNWMEYAGWDPGYPVELEPSWTETFGISWLPTSSGEQMVEHAAATDEDSIDKAAQEFEDHFRNIGMKIPINPIHVFEEAAREFKVDIDMMKMKIHKYPPSIQVFDDQLFTIPRLVSIGPYHNGHINQLKQVEKAKHVAAYHCIIESGHSVQDMYGAVTSAAYDARSLYDKDVMAQITDNDFLIMMFYDACFLVQYFACITDGGHTMDPSLRSFFDFNRKAIRHDIVLLENQLPWRVVEAVMRFRPVDMEAFIAFWKQYLQDRKVRGDKPLVLDDSFEPPHLLGLLRFYIVGKGNMKRPTQVKPNMISASVSAIELAEYGIKLTANNETTNLINMGIYKRGMFAELSMAPLSLDDERANFLMNMAALELCTTANFEEAEPEDSAVCSYLLLLSLLVHREEDVQELRTKHLLQGGAGLINKDALTFFTRLQSLPLRRSNCYVRIMMEVENYKVKRQVQIKLHVFLYKNKRTIFAIFSVIGVLVSILGTLMSLKMRSNLD